MKVPLTASWPNPEQLQPLKENIKDNKDIARIKEDKTLNRAICYAYFSIFNDCFVLPFIFICMMYIIENPLFVNGYLCRCCDGWREYSCLEKPTECCCECRGIGNTLFGTPFQISFILYCALIGLIETAILIRTILTFLFYWILKCKSLSQSMMNASSFNGYKLRNDIQTIIMVIRIISFIWILLIIVFKYNFECSCFRPGATQYIEYGTQYIAYNQLIYVMLFHLIFCAIFLISPLILITMLRNINPIKTDKMVFKLHYINAYIKYKKHQ